jgi:Na+/H+ antiporter NhaD/arsenite permease-like protein
MHYQTTLTLVIFVLTYAGVAVGHVWELHLDRTGIALLGAIALVVTGCITGKQALNSINFSSLVTGILSNLMSNAAAIMLLIHLVDLHNPVNGYLLSLANSFAGNFILLGSLANLIVVEEAKSIGVKISFGEFLRYGLPITLASYAVLGAWILLMT